MKGQMLIKSLVVAALSAGALGAFTIPSTVAAQQVVVAITAPPTPIVEVVPARPSPRHIWVAGYHRWVEGRYVWVKGYWALPPRGMHVWVPGHWDRAQGGWVRVEGHWAVK